MLKSGCYSSTNTTTSHGTGRLLVVLLCVVVMGLAAGGYYLYRQQERSIIETHCDNLQALVKLKADEITAWRQERLGDARMNSSGIIQLLVQQWSSAPTPDLLETIRQRFLVFQQNEGYVNLVLINPQGTVITSLQQKNEGLEPDEQYLVERTLVAGQPVFGDFYYCRNCQRIMLNLAAPIFDSAGQEVAVLMLIADPERDLYPLINRRPVTLHDIATLLLRKEGGEMILLNPHEVTSLQPLQRYVLAAHYSSMVGRVGFEPRGVVHGRNNRGLEVFSTLHPIAGSPWYLSAELDANLILAKSRFRGGGILMLVLLGTIIVGGLGKMIQLSQQKNASERLLQLERESNLARGEIHATLYGIGDGVISTGDSGLVTRMNAGAEALTGWREWEALRQHLTTIFPLVDEETGQAISLPMHQVLNDGRFVQADRPALLQTRDGQQRPVTNSWSPIRGEDGKVVGMVLIFRDQTGRRDMEKARLESTKRYTDLVESVNDFIWETGPDHRYTFANKHCRNLLGYTREEFIGKTWYDILCKEVEPEEFILRFRAILDRREPYSQLCRTFVKKDGSRVILESTGTPIYDSQGIFCGYRGITRDVTDRKKAEDDQRKLQEQLFQAQKMETVGRLAGGVAHDFNNMLTVICGHLGMMLKELNIDHPHAKQLKAAQQAAQHSADLTRQLLAFARKQVISPKILDLNQVISESLKMLRYLIGEHIELFWNPDINLWLVQMDPTQINQILTNLIVNARDAMSGHGCLVIETSNRILERAESADSPQETDAYVVLTLCDDGVGMDEGTQSAIFEPFFTTKTEGKGTGLGLATVYGIVQQNGGYIHVCSAPGEGSTFAVYFPKATKGVVVAPPKESWSAQIPQQATVLIVDDEPAILDIGQSILEQLGITVLTTSSPTEALAMFTQHASPIDLVLTDIIMPEMDGEELARRINQIHPTVKILFMSGYTADIISSQGVLNTDIELIEKPFSVSALRRIVLTTLNQPMHSGVV